MEKTTRAAVRPVTNPNLTTARTIMGMYWTETSEKYAKFLERKMLAPFRGLNRYLLILPADSVPKTFIANPLLKRKGIVMKTHREA